jgi:putative membrane protein
MTVPVQAALQAVWQTWSLPIPLTLILLAAAIFYLRGWMHLHAARVDVLPAWRASSFILGLFCIWVALGSPLAAFDEQLLTVHMIQHLLLMTIAPPLILLGAPLMPLLHGLPRSVVQGVIAPVLRWPVLQSAGQFLTRPAVCWLAAAGALVGWHVPAAFTLGLQSEAWHVVEHSSFLATGFMFWWPVIEPWPSGSSVATRATAVVRANGVARADSVGRGSTDAGSGRWWILLYLFFATIPCDILSAFLAFSERLAYPVYLSAPRQFGLSALEDQECAAALMWTVVTVVYLIPAMIITVRLLGVRHAREERARWEEAK